MDRAIRIVLAGILMASPILAGLPISGNFSAWIATGANNYAQHNTTKNNLYQPYLNRPFDPTQPNPVTLPISTIPQGAQVYVNDQYAGLTPLNYQTPPGNMNIRAEKDGFIPYDQFLQVDSKTTDGVQMVLSKEHTNLTKTGLPVDDLSTAAAGTGFYIPNNGFVKDESGNLYALFSQPSPNSMTSSYSYVVNGKVVSGSGVSGEIYDKYSVAMSADGGKTWKLVGQLPKLAGDSTITIDGAATYEAWQADEAKYPVQYHLADSGSCGTETKFGTAAYWECITETKFLDSISAKCADEKKTEVCGAVTRITSCVDNYDDPKGPNANLMCGSYTYGAGGAPIFHSIVSSDPCETPHSLATGDGFGNSDTTNQFDAATFSKSVCKAEYQGSENEKAPFCNTNGCFSVISTIQDNFCSYCAKNSLIGKGGHSESSTSSHKLVLNGVALDRNQNALVFYSSSRYGDTATTDTYPLQFGKTLQRKLDYEFHLLKVGDDPSQTEDLLIDRNSVQQDVPMSLILNPPSPNFPYPYPDEYSALSNASLRFVGFGNDVYFFTENGNLYEYKDDGQDFKDLKTAWTLVGHAGYATTDASGLAQEGLRLYFSLPDGTVAALGKTRTVSYSGTGPMMNEGDGSTIYVNGTDGYFHPAAKIEGLNPTGSGAYTFDGDILADDQGNLHIVFSNNSKGTWSNGNSGYYTPGLPLTNYQFIPAAALNPNLKPDVAETDLYTQPGCQACEQVKEFLDHNQIRYQMNPEAGDSDLGHAIQNAQALGHYPFTVITDSSGSYDFIYGYDPIRLARALGVKYAQTLFSDYSAPVKLYTQDNGLPGFFAETAKGIEKVTYEPTSDNLWNGQTMSNDKSTSVKATSLDNWQTTRPTVLFSEGQPYRSANELALVQSTTGQKIAGTLPNGQSTATVYTNYYNTYISSPNHFEDEQTASQIIPGAAFLIPLDQTTDQVPAYTGNLESVITEQGTVTQDGQTYYKIKVDLNKANIKAQNSQIEPMTFEGTAAIGDAYAHLTLDVENQPYQYTDPYGPTGSHDLSLLSATDENGNWAIANNLALPDIVTCNGGNPIETPAHAHQYLNANQVSPAQAACLAAYQTEIRPLATDQQYQYLKEQLRAQILKTDQATLSDQASEYENAFGNDDQTIFIPITPDAWTPPGIAQTSSLPSNDLMIMDYKGKIFSTDTSAYQPEITAMTGWSGQGNDAN